MKVEIQFEPICFNINGIYKKKCRIYQISVIKSRMFLCRIIFPTSLDFVVGGESFQGDEK